MNPAQRLIGYIMGAFVGFIGIAAILANLPEDLELPNLPETTGLGEILGNPLTAFLAVGLVLYLATLFKRLRMPLFIGGMVALLYAILYTELPVALVEFDWGSTPIGTWLEDEYGDINNRTIWLVLLGTFALIWLSRPKFKDGHHVPFVDQAFIYSIILICLAAVGLIAVWTTDIEDRLSGNWQPEADCPSLREQLGPDGYTQYGMSRVVGLLPVSGEAAPLIVQLCENDDDPVVVNVPLGSNISVVFSTRFKNDRPEITNAVQMGDFVQIEQFGRGGSFEAYRIFPRSGDHSGFGPNLRSVEITIQAVQVAE